MPKFVDPARFKELQDRECHADHRAGKSALPYIYLLRMYSRRLG